MVANKKARRNVFYVSVFAVFFGVIGTIFVDMLLTHNTAQSVKNSRLQFEAAVTVRRAAGKLRLLAYESTLFQTESQGKWEEQRARFIEAFDRYYAVENELKREISQELRKNASDMRRLAETTSPPISHENLHEYIRLQTLIDAAMNAQIEMPDPVAEGVMGSPYVSARGLLFSLSVLGMALMLVLLNLWWRQVERSDLRAATLEQAQKDLQNMAASIAHEVNNQLGVIQNSIALLPRGGAHVPQLIDFFQGAVDQIRQLTQDLADFGRVASGHNENSEKLDLVECVDLVAKQVSQDIEMLPSSPLFVNAQRHSLSRAIHNVVKNAFEAGGPVTLWFERTSTGAKLFCSDSGPGLSHDFASHLGQPFYTTKARGTGLGLTLVIQTMRNHGGSFTLENRSGKGALAELYFPASALI